MYCDPFSIGQMSKPGIPVGMTCEAVQCNSKPSNSFCINAAKAYLTGEMAWIHAT
jgi:hypothetical protein